MYNLFMNEKTKNPVGRPPTENPASTTLPRVRVTPDKLAAYKKSAEQSGQSFSAWIRKWLDKGIKEEKDQ